MDNWLNIPCRYRRLHIFDQRRQLIVVQPIFKCLDMVVSVLLLQFRCCSAGLVGRNWGCICLDIYTRMVAFARVVAWIEFAATCGIDATIRKRDSSAWLEHATTCRFVKNHRGQLRKELSFAMGHVRSCLAGEVVGLVSCRWTCNE